MSQTGMPPRLRLASITKTEGFMTERYRDRRKIDPSRGDRLGDGTPNDNDRV